MIFVIYFAVKPYLSGFDDNGDKLSLVLESINNMMIFMGLGINFATLQDASKTSIKYEKKIWENPKKGRWFILMIILVTFLTLAFGVFGYFIAENENIKEVSFGALVLGIGLVGFLKTAIDVFENHRKDTNTNANNV
jgi:O-antigen/teichoic acid export membrane protein